MKNEKKLNNKGFSLVELIIVIAIMAVLIGVLAPQYMRYVERGRATADRDNIEAVVNAIQVYAVDPAATSRFAGGETVTFRRTGGTPAPAAATGTIADALTNAGMDNDAATFTLTNQNTFQSCTITVTITTDPTTHEVTAFNVEATETP